MNKAGGAVLGGTIIVMAWTGVYFSTRQPRSVEEPVGMLNETNSLYYYESDTGDVNVTVDFVKRDKIKEVCETVFSQNEVNVKSIGRKIDSVSHKCFC